MQGNPYPHQRKLTLTYLLRCEYDKIINNPLGSFLGILIIIVFCYITPPVTKALYTPFYYYMREKNYEDW